MTTFNIELCDLVPIDEEFRYKKSQQLVAGINKNDEFNLVELRTYELGETAEVIVVEARCDGVPDKNRFGFKYKEKFAMVVFSEENDLPLVIPLRNDFPIVAHMNSPMKGLPRSLCLYFEPIVSVLRTWTAERFLRRITWWIESSSTNELHLTDQPLEQMFFTTSQELVLPENYTKLVSRDDIVLSIERIESRKNGETVIVSRRINTSSLNAKLIILPFPAIIHSEVELPSTNIQDLFQTLDDKGLEPLNVFYEQLKNVISEDGQPIQSVIEYTVLLTSIPLKRSENSDVEKVEYKAYWLSINPFELGERFGAAIKSNGRYYFDVMNPKRRAINELDSIEVTPMEVSFINNKSDYRAQSGMLSSGPIGALVGLGAIGSVIFEHWDRCAWGEWILIDKDHVKPHNLTRHTAGVSDIGTYKVDSVAKKSFLGTRTCSFKSLLSIDATDLSTEQMENTLNESDFIVDASTTLEYPRAISFVESAPRHCSVFLTPNGNNSVLLCEDSQRKTTLCSLESQYYRAIINDLCGNEHLKGNLGRFWSGASCRDISLKLPFSKVSIHAANLSEQIMNSYERAESSINVWEREDSTGAVRFHNIPAFKQIIKEVGDKKVVFDKGLTQKLEDSREQALPNETGGYLVGYHDFTQNAVFIVDAIPGATDSLSTTSQYARGIAGVYEQITDIRVKTGEIVDYIGEWHTHPEGCMAMPSSQDILQLADLSTKLSMDGLPAISLIVGHDDLSVLIGSIE